MRRRTGRSASWHQSYLQAFLYGRWATVGLERRSHRNAETNEGITAPWGFHLLKWLTNDPEVLATIPEGDRSPRFLELSENKLPTDRALGVTLKNMYLDSMHLNNNQLLQREES